MDTVIFNIISYFPMISTIISFSTGILSFKNFQNKIKYDEKQYVEEKSSWFKKILYVLGFLFMLYARQIPIVNLYLIWMDIKLSLEKDNEDIKTHKKITGKLNQTSYELKLYLTKYFRKAIEVSSFKDKKSNNSVKEIEILDEEPEIHFNLIEEMFLEKKAQKEARILEDKKQFFRKLKLCILLYMQEEGKFYFLDGKSSITKLSISDRFGAISNYIVFLEDVKTTLEESFLYIDKNEPLRKEFEALLKVVKRRYKKLLTTKNELEFIIHEQDGTKHTRIPKHHAS